MAVSSLCTSVGLLYIMFGNVVLSKKGNINVKAAPINGYDRKGTIARPRLELKEQDRRLTALSNHSSAWTRMPMSYDRTDTQFLHQFEAVYQMLEGSQES